MQRTTQIARMRQSLPFSCFCPPLLYSADRHRGLYNTIVIRHASRAGYRGSRSRVSDIFATFSHRIKNTTTRSEPTCRCTRTRRSEVTCAEQAACFPCQSWGAVFTGMFEFEFPTGPVWEGRGREAPPYPDLWPCPQFGRYRSGSGRCVVSCLLPDALERP